MDKYQNKTPRTTLKDLRRPQLEPPKPKRSLTPFLAGAIAVMALSGLTSRLRNDNHPSPPANPPPVPSIEQQDSSHPSMDKPDEPEDKASSSED